MFGIEASAMKQQRRGTLAPAAPLHLTDKDDMVAFVIAAAVEALESGGRAGQQRHTRQARLKPQAGPSVRTPNRKALGQPALVNTIGNLTAVLTALLSGLAAISLVVGGIGVMNIMLVSVTERIREIGLRKALGATPGVIMQQFLVEASVLGLLGGALGIALGVVGANVITRIINQPVIISPAATLLALTVSLVIGIVAGVYPAYRAARLAPIDALRNE